MISLAGLGMACVWFYSLILVESMFLWFLIEYNRPSWCALSVLSTIGLIALLTDINFFTMAWHNPGITVLIILGYFIFGVVWALGKWYLFVKERREKYNEIKASWFLQRSLDGTLVIISGPSSVAASKWEDSWEYKKFKNRNGGLAPLVRDNKDRVITWMSFWPWSMVWTIINDPIKKAFKTIYNYIHNSLQSISNNVFKDVQ